MCLAEVLRRIPDKAIRDKISGADWQSHLRQSSSLLLIPLTGVYCLRVN